MVKTEGYDDSQGHKRRHAIQALRLIIPDTEHHCSLASSMMGDDDHCEEPFEVFELPHVDVSDSEDQEDDGEDCDCDWLSAMLLQKSPQRQLHQVR